MTHRPAMCGHHTRPMAADPPPTEPGGRPPYTSYRSRPRLLGRERAVASSELRRRPTAPRRPARGEGSRPPWRADPEVAAGRAGALVAAVRALAGCSSSSARRSSRTRSPSEVRGSLGAGAAARLTRRRSSSWGPTRARRRPRSPGAHDRPEPLGLDHAHARRRRARREAVDPARHDRRHPRPRARQDQRGVRVSAAPRSRSRRSSSTSGSRSTTSSR